VFFGKQYFNDSLSHKGRVNPKI